MTGDMASQKSVDFWKFLLIEYGRIWFEYV